ncbi:MAG: protein-L-isoaspartate(D-aspartate) O-methyltransferase [Chloroflexi bacterium]|nr:MAG: protein-L-isoaspartate(D-aspartate) O-methyltransferase [Chloroflexota bacterium]TME16239.1 MAG: protein-L-isoaspartate(D-aspartate) O-methyltransferase [Chloroflexota bacterium]TME18971.1 MAG: protein-L-isoaspartate(D-aspartate) O-methyltransferase [Chloroflexota bacterium]
MIEEQLRPNGVTDERVLRAMAEVPREEFVPPEVRDLAYEDHPLEIGAGQTISQPLIVAWMTQAVRPEPDEVGLEVGAGSGYQAAVLSRLVRKVITVEREPELAARAAETLRRLGYANVEVVTGDGTLGWPAEAPYSVILVAAAARRVPPALIDQLAEGGRMAIPVESGRRELQELLLIRRRDGRIFSEVLFPVRFVPLIEGS